MAHVITDATFEQETSQGLVLIRLLPLPKRLLSVTMSKLYLFPDRKYDFIEDSHKMVNMLPSPDELPPLVLLPSSCVSAVSPTSSPPIRLSAHSGR